jgi:hypothetical protein
MLWTGIMIELCNMHPNYIFGTDSAQKSFPKRPQNLRKLYNSPQLNKQVLGQLDWFLQFQEAPRDWKVMASIGQMGPQRGADPMPLKDCEVEGGVDGNCFLIFLIYGYGEFPLMLRGWLCTAPNQKSWFLRQTSTCKTRKDIICLL